MDTTTQTFIPVSRTALTNCINQPASKNLENFHQLLGACYQRQSQVRLQQLIKNYLPFSPDRDTRVVLDYSPEEKIRLLAKFKQDLTRLLTRANYIPLSIEDLETILNLHSPHGLKLKVDLTEFDELAIFYRGSDRETLEERDWRKLYLKNKSWDIDVYQRLFIMLKLKPEQIRLDELMEKENLNQKQAQKRLKKIRNKLPANIHDQAIYLKTFKRIPKVDLEMLFPNTQIQLKFFDKLQLSITCGGGTVGGIMATATKLTATASPVGMITAIIGLGGVIFRQITKIMGQRTRYMMKLAQKLYFHNLANNRAVLTLLANRAQEEEFKEVLLAYQTLLDHETALTPDQLQQAIEEKLRQCFSIEVRFDIDDALRKLEELELLIAHPNGEFSVKPLDEAQSHLEHYWKTAWKVPDDSEMD